MTGPWNDYLSRCSSQTPTVSWDMLQHVLLQLRSYLTDLFALKDEKVSEDGE